MNRAIDDVFRSIQRELDITLDKVRLFRDLSADITRYAAERLRGRHPAAGIRTDPVGAVLDQLILDASYRLIRVKSETVARMREVERLERAARAKFEQAPAWEGAIQQAEQRGDPALVEEARAHERACREEAAQIKAEHERQSKDVERLRAELGILYQKIEDARLVKARLDSRRRPVRDIWSIEEQTRWMDQMLRLLQGLAELDEPFNENVLSSQNKPK